MSRFQSFCIFSLNVCKIVSNFISSFILLFETLDSKAKIGGNKERHVQSGSRLSLSCRIDEYTGPPTFVFWYRNSEVINYSERKSILIRSGNLQTKNQKQHPSRRLKLSNGENEKSSLMPTATFMLSNSHNPSKTNISQIYGQVIIEKMLIDYHKVFL